MVTRLGFRTLCWIHLALISFIGFSIFALIYSLSPLLPLIRTTYGISFAQVGVLYSTPLLMVALLGVPSGYLADRLGLRVSVAVGVLIMALGGVFRGLLHSYLALQAFTVVFGLGVAITLPNLPKFVRRCFPCEMTGTATGIYGTAIMLGITAALALTRTIIFSQVGSLHGALLTWGVVMLIAALLWLAGLLIEFEEPPHRAKKPGLGLLNRKVLYLGLYFFLVAYVFYTLSGWLPTIFIHRDMTASTASLITSLLGFTGLLTVFLLQRYSDRIGLRKPFIIVPAFLTIPSIAALLLVPSTLVAWLAVIVLGVTLNLMFNMAYLLPAEAVSPELVGSVSGFVLSIGYLGALLGPWIFGYLRDITGAFELGMTLLFAVSTLLLIIIIPIPETGPKK